MACKIVTIIVSMRLVILVLYIMFLLTHEKKNKTNLCLDDTLNIKAFLMLFAAIVMLCNSIEIVFVC